jgi:hypothetical protein
LQINQQKRLPRSRQNLWTVALPKHPARGRPPPNPDQPGQQDKPGPDHATPSGGVDFAMNEPMVCVLPPSPGLVNLAIS